MQQLRNFKPLCYEVSETQPKKTQAHKSQPHQKTSIRLTKQLPKVMTQNPQVYDANYDSDSDSYVAAISSDMANQLEPINANVQFGKITSNSMIDSGSFL